MRDSLREGSEGIVLDEASMGEVKFRAVVEACVVELAAGVDFIPRRRGVVLVLSIGDFSAKSFAGG